MPLTAKGIRQDTVTRLLAYAPVAAIVGTRVYDDRTDPLPVEELPAVVVRTPRLRGEQGRNLHVPNFAQIEELEIECHQRSPSGGTTSDAADVAGSSARDDLEEACKDGLFTDPVWVAQFEQIDRLEVRRGANGEGHERRWVAVIQVDCKFNRCWQPRSDFLADNLQTVHINVDMIEPGELDPGSTPSGQTDAAATHTGLDT